MRCLLRRIANEDSFTQNNINSYQHNQALHNNYAQRERSYNNYNNLQKNNSCSTAGTTDCEIEGVENAGMCKGDDARNGNGNSSDSVSSGSVDSDQADIPLNCNGCKGYDKRRKEDENNSFMDRCLCYWQENLYGESNSECNIIFKKK